MQEEKRTIGYICPDCGQAVVEEKTLFALTAGPSRVSCGCGKSQLDLETDGRKFRLWVPCGLCGEKHQAEMEAGRILKDTGVGLACSKLGQLCCYVGEHYAVLRAMENLQIVADKTRAAGQQQEDEAFLDSVIMHEVMAELKDIAARPGGISCSCGSNGYKIAVRHAAIDLICADCGAKLRIPAATDEDLDRLCCQMKLQIRSK